MLAEAAVHYTVEANGSVGSDARASAANWNAEGEQCAMPQTPQTPQMKALINEEEAHTELLATLAAARELGPDMDETLTSRYVERLGALFPNPARDETRLRSDVLALLVSARTHGSDADAARVKDFLARALAPQAAPPVMVQPPAPPAPSANFASYLPMLIGAAAIVAIMAATHGQAFWLIWLLPMFIWGGRGRRRRRYSRYGYWDGSARPGMPPPSGRRQLPPGDGPEIL